MLTLVSVILVFRLRNVTLSLVDLVKLRKKSIVLRWYSIIGWLGRGYQRNDPHFTKAFTLHTRVVYSRQHSSLSRALTHDWVWRGRLSWCWASWQGWRTAKLSPGKSSADAAGFHPTIKINNQEGSIGEGWSLTGKCSVTRAWRPIAVCWPGLGTSRTR